MSGAVPDQQCAQSLFGLIARPLREKSGTSSSLTGQFGGPFYIAFTVGGVFSRIIWFFLWRQDPDAGAGSRAAHKGGKFAETYVAPPQGASPVDHHDPDFHLRHATQSQRVLAGDLQYHLTAVIHRDGIGYVRAARQIAGIVPVHFEHDPHVDHGRRE